MSAARAFAAFAAMRQKPRLRHEVRISFGRNRFFQKVAHAAEELRYRFLSNGRSFRGRMDTRVEKNFICINVSDPGDQFLIEQERMKSRTQFVRLFYLLLYCLRCLVTINPASFMPGPPK